MPCSDAASIRHISAMIQEMVDAGPGVLVAGEAERLIESLRPMGVEDVGTLPWMEQRGWIEKLNLQVPSEAPARREDQSSFELSTTHAHANGRSRANATPEKDKWYALLARDCPQAHHNAQTNSEEFVNEALASYDKVSVLVHELIVLEIWKEKILPLLGEHQACTGCFGRHS